MVKVLSRTVTKNKRGEPRVKLRLLFEENETVGGVWVPPSLESKLLSLIPQCSSIVEVRSIRDRIVREARFPTK